MSGTPNFLDGGETSSKPTRFSGWEVHDTVAMLGCLELGSYIDPKSEPASTYNGVVCEGCYDHTESVLSYDELPEFALRPHT